MMDIYAGCDSLHYYAKMAAWLLKQQSRDGSWNGDGVGTVYGTSIALTSARGVPCGVSSMFS